MILIFLAYLRDFGVDEIFLTRFFLGGVYRRKDAVRFLTRFNLKDAEEGFKRDLNDFILSSRSKQ